MPDQCAGCGADMETDEEEHIYCEACRRLERDREETVE